MAIDEDWTLDAPEKKVRAQKSSKIKVSPPFERTYIFSTNFGKWEPKGDNTTFFSLHEDNTEGNRTSAPLDFMVKGDKLVGVLQGTVGDRIELFSVQLVPDQWDDWEVIFLAKPENGRVTVIRNGVEIVRKQEKTVELFDENIYMKLGLYVWGEWPVGTISRKMYLQL